jgi:hypothetical protein
MSAQALVMAIVAAMKILVLCFAAIAECLPPEGEPESS